MRKTSSLTRDCEEGCQWDDASYIDSLVRDTPAGLRQARLPCQYQNCVQLRMSRFSRNTRELAKTEED